MFQNCECKYCVRRGFPVTRKIEDGMYWLEIPKNGSASIKARYDVEDQGRQRIVTCVGEEEGKVLYIVLRDPVLRFIGSFNHYFTPSGERYHLGTAFLQKFDIDIKTTDTKDIFDFVVRHLDELSTSEDVHHFYPQTHFIKFTDDLMFQKILFIDIDELTDTLETDRINHTPLTVKISPTPEQLSFLKEDVYKKDYDFFKTIGFTPTRTWKDLL